MTKRLFILFLLLAPALLSARGYRVQEIPNVQVENRYRFTSNPDGILSAQAVERIDSICYQLRHRDIAQVSVVAVRSIAGQDVFDFAYRLFTSWGVGRADTNNGLGILLVEDVHEIRFLTGGGLEGVLPDALCKRIQTRYMLPYFREGRYSEGMVAGVEAVDRVLSGSELDRGGNDDYAPTEDGLPAGILLLVIVLSMFVPLGGLLLWTRRARKCPSCHAKALRQQSVEVIERKPDHTVVEYIYRCGRCGKTFRKREHHRNDPPSGGIGSGAGGGMVIGGQGFGSGRGFGGGFGGGGFGGGGAGTRW